MKYVTVKWSADYGENSVFSVRAGHIMVPYSHERYLGFRTILRSTANV